MCNAVSTVTAYSTWCDLASTFHGTAILGLFFVRFLLCVVLLFHFFVCFLLFSIDVMGWEMEVLLSVLIVTCLWIHIVLLLRNPSKIQCPLSFTLQSSSEVHWWLLPSVLLSFPHLSFKLFLLQEGETQVFSLLSFNHLKSPAIFFFLL